MVVSSEVRCVCKAENSRQVRRSNVRNPQGDDIGKNRNMRGRKSDPCRQFQSNGWALEAIVVSLFASNLKMASLRSKRTTDKANVKIGRIADIASLSQRAISTNTKAMWSRPALVPTEWSEMQGRREICSSHSVGA